jgi:3-oxoadipate enol-lactonase
MGQIGVIRWLVCVSGMLLAAAGVFAQAPTPAQTSTAAQSESPRAAPAVGKFITVDGGKLWYEECGAANPGTSVVLMHDGLVDSITWDGVWEPLCTKYHLVRYDRRGYGRSDPAKTPFVPEDDLYKVMREVHMDRAIVMGNSSGGGLALDFALAHPDMVEALFLIGPTVHGMASSDYFNERATKNSAPMDLGDVKAAAKNWSEDRFIFGGEARSARKQLFDALVQNPQVLKAGGALEIRPSPPTAMRLTQIRVPTLVLVGEDDIADVFAFSGAIEAALPIVTFEVWKDTGHLIQIQRPAEVVARFNRFVSQTTRKEFPLTDLQLAVYAGRYSVFNRTGTVTVQDHHLVLEFPGDPYYWLFPSSETKFFLRTGDGDFEFIRDAGGKVVEMALHYSDGSVIHCARIDAAALH